MNKPSSARLMPVLLGFLLVVGLYILVVKPQRADLAEARDSTESAQIQLESARATLGQLKREATGAGSGGDPLTVAIPSTPELAQLLRDLQSVAARVGVTYVSVAPSVLGPNPDGPGGSVTLAVNASGPKASLDAYLGQLRDHPRLFVVEQVSRQVPQDATASTTLNLTVRVFTTQVAKEVEK